MVFRVSPLCHSRENGNHLFRMLGPIQRIIDSRFRGNDNAPEDDGKIAIGDSASRKPPGICQRISGTLH